MTLYSDREPMRRDEAADLRAAYEHGRRDQKRLRRRHPIAMTILVLAAAVGLVVLALAAVNGSFGGAGQVVDQNLATAAQQAQPVVQNAADKAGQAVHDATTTTNGSAPGQPH